MLGVGGAACRRRLELVTIMRNTLKLAGATAALALVTPAHAFIWTINNVMDGSQENPPVNTPATGTIVGTYDDVSNVLDITIEFQNLLGAQTAAHVHKGAVGTNGGVIFDIGVGSPKNLNVVLTDLQETDLLSNLYYVNVHSQAHPGGEIRGQMTPVPEPATMVALGAGLAALAARRRRK
jgi:hypothetical protein